MTAKNSAKKSQKAQTKKVAPDRPVKTTDAVPDQVANPNPMVMSAKEYPEKLKSGQVQRLQRMMGNKAVRQFLVSKNQQPIVQREGDPFAPFKDKKKGPHDYRLEAEYDPAPKGWVKKQKNNVDYFHQASTNSWKWNWPVLLKRGMSRYERGKFRDAIRELQDKLISALGPGWKGAGFSRADGVFGWRTARGIRRFQKSVKLPESGIATYDTWNKLDQKGSVGVKHGRVSYAWNEKLVGSTPGTYGMQATYGWAEKNNQLDVTVNINFTNLAAEGPNVAKWIQNIWNIFKVTYKKDKDGKQTRKKNKNMPLNFVVGVKSGKKGGPTLYPDNQVLLWKGVHPNWKKRNATWPANDKKFRSDGGNWRLDDADVKTMVGHEFGHLIGLEDEYARTHKDIKRLTGKTPIGTTKDEKLTPDQEAKYKQLTTAALKVDEVKSLKDANKLAWGWNKVDNQVAFLLQEYNKRTGNKLNTDFKTTVKTTADNLKAKAPSFAEMLDTYRQLKAAGKPFPGYAGLVKQTQNRLAKEAWQVWAGKFPDGNNRSVWWNFWGASTREYVSGGLMGDYHLIGTKKKEDRPNAVAHTHKHPLEPRHVRRFAEYVSTYNNEVWEAEYR